MVSLGELVTGEGLHEGLDPETGSLLVDLEALSRRVLELVQEAEREGVMLVVEGHYAHLVVPREHVLKALVLRRSPYELREVLASRGYEGRKLSENLQAEILDVCLCEAVDAYGPELVYEIDATGRRPEEVLEEALLALRAPGGKVGIVDWLGLLERDGRLDDFF